MLKKNLSRCIILIGFLFVQRASSNDAATVIEQGAPATTEQTFSVTSTAKASANSALNCLMLCIGQLTTDDDILYKLGKTLKFDLEFSDQLKVTLEKTPTEPASDILPKLFAQGTSLCLFIKQIKKFPDGNQQMEITLKEPSTGQCLFNRLFTCNEKSIIYASHAIANELNPILTGQSAPFLSTLAYCKQISKNSKVLCIADYACRKERILFERNSINLAPRWHSQAPILFYSQLTNSNNRLMSYNLKTGRVSIVCNYPGLNMQPSFSADGTRAVLCLSIGEQGNSELFFYDQKEQRPKEPKKFNPGTNNTGNNASPNMLPNEDVIFCSDFEKKIPQIYYLDRKTNKTHCLTNGKGYCAAPSYNAATNSVVYSRLENGYFQLFAINLNDKNRVEHQLTTGAGDKQEPVYSDCGRYIAFAYDCKTKDTKKTVSQIAVLNIASKKIRVLTTGPEAKTFPCWTNETYYT